MKKVNKFAIWDNGKGDDKYTVLKNGRVYVMSENPYGKSGVDEYICSEIEIDQGWMDREMKLTNYEDTPVEVQNAINHRY
jgi:hypothetical protein